MGTNFDATVDRRNTCSRKWDALQEVFGSTEVLPMWVADMDFPAPPTVIEAVTARAAHGVYGYPTRSEAYYQAVTGWLQRRHAWQVQSQWITSTPAVITAISVAIQTFTKPGDQVIIQPPVYPPFFSCVTKNGRQVLENPLRCENGHYTFDLEDLKRKLNPNVKMFIFCSPHNPVGRVWTKEELTELGQVLEKHDLVILSDEMHCDLTFKNHSFTPFSTISPAVANKMLTFISPAKTFNIAGFYNSITITENADLRHKFMTALDNLELLAGNLFGTVAFETAYQTGDEWLDGLLPYLENNADFLCQFIDQRVPKLRMVKPEGTYLAWLDCRELGLSDKELKGFFVNEAKVGVNSGDVFGKQGEGFVRLNFGCSKELLREGMERIERAIK